VRVTNLQNGRSLIVRVNDRGPYSGNRIIDVSQRAAHLLGFRKRGTAWVRVEYVGRAPMTGSDDRMLEATLRRNSPAPLPSDVRFADFPAQPPPVSYPRLASVLSDRETADPPAVQPMSFSDPPRGLDGTDQFLNGRGLY
jgi:rare lipoprotein A (peptidoglycan hydrolase)